MTDMTRDKAVEWLRDHVDDLRSAAQVLRESPWGAKLAATIAEVDKAADEGTLAITALEAAREDAWQPIETAPRDGTWVLLAGGDINYGWDEPSKPTSVVGQWIANSERWQFAWYDGGFYGEYETPTHWRPLPAPPAIDQARGKGVADEA